VALHLKSAAIIWIQQRGVIATPSLRSFSLGIALLFRGIGVIDVMTAERGNKEKRL
jgi:hypothetical protein